jgi:hypothetical protein
MVDFQLVRQSELAAHPACVLVTELDALVALLPHAARQWPLGRKVVPLPSLAGHAGLQPWLKASYLRA